MVPRLQVLADKDALARRVSEWLLALAKESRQTFSVCLSGGETPKALYRRLAQPPCAKSFPWPRTHWFFGDERFAPPHDPRSNFGMAREAFLAQAPVPPENIHPMPTQDIAPEAAAAQYERALRAFYGAARLDVARPLFDVTLLGLGGDGHTASLFPQSNLLDEREHWVAATLGPKAEPRITLTFPPLGASAHVAFLVAGRDKRDILDRFLSGDAALPASRLEPSGEVLVFCDAAARR